MTKIFEFWSFSVYIKSTGLLEWHTRAGSHRLTKTHYAHLFPALVQCTFIEISHDKRLHNGNQKTSQIMRHFYGFPAYHWMCKISLTNEILNRVFSLML